MDPQKPTAPTRTLNYFQQSPVRGQLEPCDSTPKSGWRYLQCTDTPNELRVLLPPLTALIYGHILRAERLELHKDKAASWDRIMQIRHLKDRMIRKCQRLARASTTKDKTTGRMMMFTLHAPPDFRLKEMERWYRDQGPEFPRLMAGGSTSTNAHYCSKCGPLGVTASAAPIHRSNSTSTRGATSTRTPLSKPKTSAPSTRNTSPVRGQPKSHGHTHSKTRAPPPNTHPIVHHTEVPAIPLKTARVPTRVPKRPSESSSRTAVEQEEPPKYIVIKADLIKQEGSVATVSRSSSLRSNPPPRVPRVIRQSETPPTGTPPAGTPRAASPYRPIEEVRSHSRSSSRSRSPLPAANDIHPPRASIQSPDPLPIPYRPRDFHTPQYFDDAASQVLTSSPRSIHEEQLEPVPEPVVEAAVDPIQPSDDPRAPSPDGTLVSSTLNDPAPSPPAPTTGQPLETIHEGTEPGSEVGSTSHRPLMRRRSSLKKRDSMSKLSVASQSKSVTWAMDKDWTDQMSKFVKSTNEAEVAAYELGELRQQYHEEVAMMRIMCHDAVVAAEQLGLNTDMLKREEQALAEQENKVVVITDHMEHKEGVYREKVLTVLEDTKRVVSLCDKKRDQHDI
ncbi:hypothetical protein BDW22DRAFT_108235 [Trametopsis cervina]|nr:hypothetical protein BDW22DRAFT_108235 [Trametopsis cervina]